MDLIERAGHTALPPGPDRTIGGILLDSGKITSVDAERVLRLQKEQGLRFGEACVKLGLVSQADIEIALSDQYRYPYLRPGQASFSKELVAAYEPFSAAVEGLRALRTQLLIRWFGTNREALAIASPGRGDGRTYLAANLAVVFSQLGEDTLLIDGNMRQPRQQAIFNLSNRTGLSSALSERAGTECIERVPHFAKLSVMTAGAVPPNPVELLSRSAFQSLLDQVRRRFDVVLIDTPAGSLGADAQAIAVRAGGALLLAREGHSRLKDLKTLSARIVSGEATVVGSVFNNF
jgi:protein-tyrosine kinase